MTARAIIVGAPRSGSGKTSVAIGLMRAFLHRGLKVRGAKSGPDYIDPAFHEAATGMQGVNLDSWAMAPDLLAYLANEQADGADLVVVESAMGLFDGIAAEPGRSGAAAELARAWGIPTLLVLDISGQSQSAAAVAKGFATFDPRVPIAGIVLNQVASERHEAQARDAIEQIGIPVLGALRRDPGIALPERHLGLVQAREHEALERYIEKLGETVANALDLDAIWAASAPLSVPDGSLAKALPPPGQRVAVADDAAFSFLYRHNARLWREAGAELVAFSPLADEGPDRSCDACWMPGGYPELHAGRLSQAANYRTAMQRFAKAKPIHGECGGFMVLGEALEDAAGERHPMLGLLGHTTSYAKRKMNLGYRQARLLGSSPLGQPGDTVRGHEFHYSRVLDPGQDLPLADLSDGLGRALGPSGARRGHVTGAFFHAIAKG